MKTTSALCVCLLLIGLGEGQTVARPEDIISRMIETGVLDGHDQMVIGRLGDGGAVLVTKVLGDRDLTSSTIDNTLIVIGRLFADPTFVEPAADRQPKTALLILKYLDLSAKDPALRKRIADTEKYVKEQYAVSLRGPK
jgi:hypothetical protein